MQRKWTIFTAYDDIGGAQAIWLEEAYLQKEGMFSNFIALSLWHKESHRALGSMDEGPRHPPTLRPMVPFQGRPEGC